LLQNCRIAILNATSPSFQGYSDRKSELRGFYYALEYCAREYEFFKLILNSIASKRDIKTSATENPVSGVKATAKSTNPKTGNHSELGKCMENRQRSMVVSGRPNTHDASIFDRVASRGDRVMKRVDKTNRTLGN
jgi:hypothetical protein